MAGFLQHRFGGFISGGAYTWRGLFSEIYGLQKLLSCRESQIVVL